MLGLLVMRLTSEEYPTSNHYQDGKFQNEEVVYNKTEKLGKILKAYIMDKSSESVPNTEIPIIPLVRSDIEKLKNNSVIRLSHSTLLIKLEGELF